MNNNTRFREFIQEFTHLIEQTECHEQLICSDGKSLLAELITHDDWLADEVAMPGPDKYQQYLLHCDSFERFSVVSFVWGPGQSTPIHNHTVWGMIGVMRGAEICEEYNYNPEDGTLTQTATHRLEQGEIDLVSPTIGDIHRVSNANGKDVSVSIHVYGANIGAVARHTYDPKTGASTPFISGYTNRMIPNIWDRSQ